MGIFSKQKPEGSITTWIVSWIVLELKYTANDHDLSYASGYRKFKAFGSKETAEAYAASLKAAYETIGISSKSADIKITSED